MCEVIAIHVLGNIFCRPRLKTTEKDKNVSSEKDNKQSWTGMTLKAKLKIYW